MQLPVFSKRHWKRLKDRTLTVDLNPATKQRILYAISEFDESWYETSDSGFNYSLCHTDLLETALREVHGWEDLKTFVKDKGMRKATLEEFIRGGAPHYVFDAVELYSRELGNSKYGFQAKINQILCDARLPWRLTEDTLFQVESEYMHEVLSCASRLLVTTGFEGAKEEFQQAQSHFDSGDLKDAIHHANLALESTMKAILGVDREKPGKLIRGMIESGIIPAYYDKFLENFEQVLRSVNIARNEELGAGHGQGAKISEVPRHLAELVVNFCGALIVFLVNHHIDSKPKEKTPPEDKREIEISDDEIPF